MISKRKVVLVGTGFVGMSMAYALENQGGVNELVLIDVLKDKAEGEAMDLCHGIAMSPGRMVIKSGNYDECKDANIVVITAGLAQKPGGQTRLELAQTQFLQTEQFYELTLQPLPGQHQTWFLLLPHLLQSEPVLSVRFS